MRYMKRALAAAAFVALTITPTAAATTTAKRVEYPSWRVHPTTTTTSTTSTTTTTLPPTTTRDIPNPVTNVRYYMRADVIELRWQYQSKTYPINVGVSTCFYADGVALCGGGIDYYRDGSDYFAVTTKAELFGGAFPRCVTLSVQVHFDDGQQSNTTAAPSTCGMW